MTSTIGQLLVSLQLTDSAFPTGLYTMSHGLEGYQQAGLMRPETVGGLLEDLLVHSIGPGDATAMSRAHDAARARDWEAVERIDHLVLASKLNHEMRRASIRSGRALIGIAGELFGGDGVDRYAVRIADRAVPGCQPVVSAVCYSAAGVPRAEAVVSELFAFSASFVGAALRMRLTDHRRAQVVLRDIAPVIETVTADACARPIDDMGGFAPMADISSARHERADGRLFTS
jgi:urease accessory protein